MQVYQLLLDLLRHPASKGRIPIAINWLNCAPYDLYGLLNSKAIASRYFLYVVSWLIVAVAIVDTWLE